MKTTGLVLAIFFAISATSSLFGNETVDTAVWHSFGIAAGVLAWLGVARQAHRSGWALIALGLTAWILGDIAWDIVSWEPIEGLTPADLLYLAGYFALAAGVVVLTRNATGRLPIDALLDGTILTCALGLMFWVALVTPSQDPGSAALQFLSVAYPMCAIFLFGVVSWMRFHPRQGLIGPGVGLLTVGVLVLVVLEPLSAAYYLFEPNVDLEPTIDRSFHFAFAIIVLSIHRRDGKQGQNGLDHLNPVRMFVLGASLATGPLTMYFIDGVRTPSLIGSSLISALVLIRFIVMSNDRERVQAELAHRASHDYLTGLPNRSMLAECLTQLPEGVSLLFVDVDRFKSVNDSYGHAVGDQLLIEISERIRQSIRSGDLAVRIGGDEFVIVCPDSDGRSRGEALVNRLTAAIDEPFDLDGIEMNVAASIGLARSQRGALADLNELLSAADAALYEVKHETDTRLDTTNQRSPTR